MKIFAAIGIVAIGAAISAWSSLANAQTYTDARETITALLKKRGAVPVTVTRYVKERVAECGVMLAVREIPDNRCHWVESRRPVRETFERILTIGDVGIEATEPPNLAPSTLKSFPDDLIATSQETINCSTAIASANISLQLVASRSASVTVTKSVTNTVGGQLGAQFPIGGGAIGSASISVSRQSTSATARTEGTTSGYAITGSGTVAIPPRTRILSSLASYKVEVSTPFTFNVLADGPLSANDLGLNRLSDIYDTVARRFTVEGVIRSTDSSKGILTFVELPFEPAECKNSDGLVINNSPATRTQSMKPLTAPVQNPRLGTAPLL